MNLSQEYVKAAADAAAKSPISFDRSIGFGGNISARSKKTNKYISFRKEVNRAVKEGDIEKICRIKAALVMGSLAALESIDGIDEEQKAKIRDTRTNAYNKARSVLEKAEAEINAGAFPISQTDNDVLPDKLSAENNPADMLSSENTLYITKGDLVDAAALIERARRAIDDNDTDVIKGIFEELYTAWESVNLDPRDKNTLKGLMKEIFAPRIEESLRQAEEEKFALAATGGSVVRNDYVPLDLREPSIKQKILGRLRRGRSQEPRVPVLPPSEALLNEENAAVDYPLDLDQLRTKETMRERWDRLWGRSKEVPVHILPSIDILLNEGSDVDYPLNPNSPVKKISVEKGEPAPLTQEQIPQFKDVQPPDLNTRVEKSKGPSLKKKFLGAVAVGSLVVGSTVFAVDRHSDEINSTLFGSDNGADQEVTYTSGTATAVDMFFIASEATEPTENVRFTPEVDPVSVPIAIGNEVVAAASSAVADGTPVSIVEPTTTPAASLEAEPTAAVIETSTPATIAPASIPIEHEEPTATPETTSDDTSEDEINRFDEDMYALFPEDITHPAEVEEVPQPQNNDSETVDEYDEPPVIELQGGADTPEVEENTVDSVEIQIPPKGGITGVFQDYVLKRYGVTLGAEESYIMYEDLFAQYEPSQIFGNVEAYEMKNGDWGFVDSGPVLVTAEGQVIIKDWLIDQGYISGE